MPSVLMHIAQILGGFVLIYLSSKMRVDNRLVRYGDWPKAMIMSLTYLAGMGLVCWGFLFGFLKPIYEWVGG